MNIALSNVTLSCHIFRSFFHQHLQEQSLSWTRCSNLRNVECRMCFLFKTIIMNKNASFLLHFILEAFLLQSGTYLFVNRLCARIPYKSVFTATRELFVFEIYRLKYINRITEIHLSFIFYLNNFYENRTWNWKNQGSRKANVIHLWIEKHDVNFVTFHCLNKSTCYAFIL